jgi:hypothetical protein
VLVITEALLTVAFQFLSTILISDLNDGVFTNMENSTEVRILQGADFVQTGLWTFAELSEPFAEGPNFHDTGHTCRAFLPFEEEPQRTQLCKFHGPAPVTDQRVVCARPSLVDLTLDLSTGLLFWLLSGQMALDGPLLMLQDTEIQPNINFSCAVPVAPRNRTIGATNLCFPNSGSNWTPLLEDPLVEFPAILESDNPFGYPHRSTMSMMIDVISFHAMFYGVHAKHAVKTVGNDGPWAMVGNGSDVEALRVTACMTNLGVKTFTVDMESSWKGKEPSMSWDREAQTYNSGTNRRQLGASLTPESLDNRACSH